MISEAFKLRQRLIDNKHFLKEIEKSKTKARVEKLLKSASAPELDILREIIKNIAAKNIHISKSILNSKKKFDSVVTLIASFQRKSTINKSQGSLKKFLVKFSHILPIVAKTVISQ